MIALFKKVAHFILFGNFFIALCACFLIASTSIQLHFTHNFYYFGLVFFATLFIYNLQRVFYKKQIENNLQSIRRKWIEENRALIKWFAYTGIIGVLIFLFLNEYKIIYYLSPLFVVSIFYFLPCVKLRKQAWIKIFVLASVWTLVTAIVPILLYDSSIVQKNIFLHVASRFCFMVAICIPFDIRDLKVDKSEDVATLPILYGEKKARGIAIAFMLLYILLIFLEYFSGMFEIKTFIALFISAIINTVLVLMTNSKRSEYFYTLVLDGTMIIQGGLLMLAQML